MSSCFNSQYFIIWNNIVGNYCGYNNSYDDQLKIFMVQLFLHKSCLPRHSFMNIYLIQEEESILYIQLVNHFNF